MKKFSSGHIFELWSTVKFKLVKFSLPQFSQLENEGGKNKPPLWRAWKSIHKRGLRYKVWVLGYLTNPSDGQMSPPDFCQAVPGRLEITAKAPNDLIFLPIPKMLTTPKLPSMSCCRSGDWTDRYILQVISIFLAATNTGYPKSVAVDSLMIMALCLYSICDNVPILLKFNPCKRGTLIYAATDQNDSNFPSELQWFSKQLHFN